MSTRSARPSRPRPPDRPAATYELTFLPGLADVVQSEVADVLGARTPVLIVPGREDSMLVRHSGRPDALLALRTVVASSQVLSFPVPRPRSLASGEYFPAIVDAVVLSARIDGARAFRFEAAGSDSSVFQRLGVQLAHATGLRQEHDPTEDVGAVVLRFRRTPQVDPAGPRPEGWDVLVRLGSRPSSARAWRVADYPGAVNATIAAAIVRLAGVGAGDRVVNLMCGSGTLLIERLLAGPAASAVGVDVSAEAVAAARANVAAAGLGDRLSLVTADIADETWWPSVPADLVLADPPWGTLTGSHANNEDAHQEVLRVAHAITRPGARLAVLTHEVKVMDRVLRGTALWRERAEVRVFQKGHHPRIYLLARAD